MTKQFIEAGNGDILSLDNNGKTTSLSKAVGTMAISLYEDYADFVKCEDKDKKTELEIKLGFQSSLLNSLSKALEATTAANRTF